MNVTLALKNNNKQIKSCKNRNKQQTFHFKIPYNLILDPRQRNVETPKTKALDVLVGLSPALLGSSNRLLVNLGLAFPGQLIGCVT